MPKAPTTIIPAQKTRKSKQQKESLHFRCCVGIMPHSSAGAAEQPQQPFLGAGLGEVESFGVEEAVELASGAALDLEGLLPIVICYVVVFQQELRLGFTCASIFYAEIIKKTESCEATPGAG